MTGISRLLWTAWLPLAMAFWGDAAHAICVSMVATNISPATANTGTYTPPSGLPGSQKVDITVSGTYISLLPGTCNGAIGFNRATLPASMARTGGGATLPYTLQSLAGGGNSLLFTGAGVPPPANRVAFSFPNPLIAGLGGTFSVTVSVFAEQQPAALQQAGAYSDSITLRVMGVVTPLQTEGIVGNFPFTVTGNVAKACTIGGVSTPGADSATIPIGANGKVNTSPIAKSYANAGCNTPSNLQLTSKSGAVKTAAPIVAGFANLINYSAAASFSGANATVDTATVPTATGPESGTAVSTTGTTPAGTLSLTITPQTNAQPLLKGTYQDTLTITITPQ